MVSWGVVKEVVVYFVDGSSLGVDGSGAQAANKKQNASANTSAKALTVRFISPPTSADI